MTGKAKRDLPALHERNRRICQLRSRGVPADILAVRFGVSREQVRKICRAFRERL
jgi:DNA-binding CsgD family transcriptional regulator